MEFGTIYVGAVGKKDKGRRKMIHLKCEYCGNGFGRSLDHHLAGRAVNTSCSPRCSNLLRSEVMDVPCSTCREPVRRNKSKAEKAYCSKKCANTTNNKLRSGEDHPMYKGGVSTYRERALEHYGEECTVCGYGVRAVLEVHHRDGDRSHNEIENLDVLCPTHHVEFEVGIRVYEGMGSRLAGKTAASEAVNLGSTPSFPTKFVM